MLSLSEVQAADIWNNADNVQRFLLLAAFCDYSMTLGQMQNACTLSFDQQPTELKIAIYQVLIDERKKGRN